MYVNLSPTSSYTHRYDFWSVICVLQHKHVLGMDAAIDLPLLRFISNNLFDWSNFTSQCRRDYSRHRYFMDSNSHGIGGSYAECVTVAWDDGVAIEFIP